MGIIKRGTEYLKRNGLRDTFYTGIQHVKNGISDVRYSSKVKHKNAVTGVDADTAQALKISVLVPVFEPDPDYLREMAASVLDQTYGNFELILADGSPAEDICAARLAKSDKRIRYVRGNEGGGISENTNAALSVATGKVIALLDQDDILDPAALELIAREFINGAEIVYTDEDKYLTDKKKFVCPYRKRDYNLDLLLSNNYICHLFAVKRSLARKVKGFNSRYDGAQDHDFILRCCNETEEDKIVHIPEVLYHWRVHEGSSAGDHMAKLYAYESGKRAVKAFLKRKKINAEVTDTPHLGFFRVEYKDEIPKDKYVLFLDDRLVPLNDDHEKILASYFAREDIGIVGGRIISKSGQIIESGYEKDDCGKIRPLFYGKNYRLPGEFNLAELVMDTEAVSKYACVVRTELVDCMEGNSYNICAKIRKRGYRVVIDPKVVFTKVR